MNERVFGGADEVNHNFLFHLFGWCVYFYFLCIREVASLRSSNQPDFADGFSIVL